MKIALKCIFLLHNILEVTDFNPTLESWTDDYIDAMGSIKEGRYIDIMLCPRETFKKCFLGDGFLTLRFIITKARQFLCVVNIF